MKQTISSTWEFQIIIIFILVFVSYLTVSVSYFKVFKAKNDIISIIERKEGLTEGATGAIGVINNYLVSNGYNAKGHCQEGYYGAVSLTATGNEGFRRVTSDDKSKYYYCVRKTTRYFEEKMTRSYYDVNLFFSLNLPVIGDIIDFGANGTTIEMDATYDCNNVRCLFNVYD
ncbi:MAG: hypothetical protein PUD34_05240 [bacterium]|nr:hypothetical protein [bacterium]